MTKSSTCVFGVRENVGGRTHHPLLAEMYLEEFGRMHTAVNTGEENAIAGGRVLNCRLVDAIKCLIVLGDTAE